MFYFSIIIPVYNSSATLDETMASVLNQSIADNIEIVLVDDGSDDGSYEICDMYAEKYPERVKVIHQKNRGSLCSRINGVTAATSDSIIFLDADDTLEEDAGNFIVKTLKENPAQVLLFDYYSESKDAVKTYVNLFEKQDNKSPCRYNKDELLDIFIDGTLNSMCPCVINRSLLESTFFLSDLRKISNGEDRLQKFYVLLNSDSVIYIPGALQFFRRISGSQGDKQRSGVVNMNIINDELTVWNIIRNDMKKYSDTLLKKLDCRELKKLLGMTERYVIQNKNKGYKKLKQIEEQDIQVLKELSPDNLNFYEKLLYKFLYNRKYYLFQCMCLLKKTYRRIRYGSKKTIS